MQLSTAFTSRLMRLALLAGLGLATAPSAQAQNPSWASLERSSSTGINSGANGQQIAVAADGSQYVTGTFGGNMALGVATLTGDGIFLAKRNAAGVVLWVNHIQPASNSNYYSNVAVDAAGNVYLTGYFSTSLVLGSTTLSSPGDDSYLAKYDAQGVLQWVRQGGSQGTYAQSIATDAAGNVLIVGDFNGSTSFGGPTMSGSGLFLYKFRPDGSVMQARQLGSSTQAVANDMVLDAAGNAYVTGNFQNTISIGSTTLTSAGEGDIFLCKLDAGGNLVWVRQSGGPDDDGARSVTVDTRGNTLIGGYFNGMLATGGSETSDILVSFFNPQGNVVWSRTLTPSVPDFYSAEAVAFDNRGGFYVTGGFQGSLRLGGQFLSAVGQSGLFVARYNGLGQDVWADAATNGGPGSASIGLGVAADANGNAYLTGALLNSVQFGTVPASTGGLDMFVAKLNAGSVLSARQAASTPALALEAYPNPATGTTSLNLPAGGGHLVLTDALGRTVREQALPTAAGPCPVSLAGLAPGLYQLRAALNNGKVASAQVQVR